MKTYKLLDKIICDNCNKELENARGYDLLSNYHLCDDCLNYLSNISISEPEYIIKYNIYNSVKWKIKGTIVTAYNKEIAASVTVGIYDDVEKNKDLCIKALFNLHDEMIKNRIKNNKI